MKKNMKIRYMSLYLLLFGIALSEQFGKNIVQYGEFDWFYTQTDHFDIYVSDSSGYHLSFLEEH